MNEDAMHAVHLDTGETTDNSSDIKIYACHKLGWNLNLLGRGWNAIEPNQVTCRVCKNSKLFEEMSIMQDSFETKHGYRNWFYSRDCISW